MKKLLTGAALATSLLVSNASAIVGLVDIEVGAGIWSSQMSGTLGTDTLNVDFEKDLKLDASSNTYFFAKFDHFIPVVPNLRYENQALTVSGTGTLAVPVAIPGLSTGLVASAPTTSNISLNMQDLTFYWGVPGLNTLTLGILDIEFGVDLKLIEGKLAFSAAGTESKVPDFSEPLPMGYLAAVVDIPFVDVVLEGSYKTLPLGDSGKVEEIKVKAAWTLPIPTPLIDWNIEGGYKQFSIELADDKISKTQFKIANSGIFYGLNVAF
jgi:outer membrane protein